VVLGTLASGALGQTVLRVDDNAAAGGDGSSWNLAYQNPQEAFAYVLAFPGQAPFHIYVAEGVYKPGDTLSPLTVTFTVPPDTKMFGGFLGVAAELDPSLRQGDPELTILSGNLDNAPGYSGNAQHVVTIGPDAVGVEFDGFHIRFGNSPDEGGGMLVTGNTQIGFDFVTIDNCIFTKNQAVRGGGLAAINGEALVLRYCTFRNNKAVDVAANPGGAEGGALYTRGVKEGDDFYKGIAIFNTLFDDNYAAYFGGAISFEDSFVRVMNCALYDNTSGSLGGAGYMGYFGVDAEFINCTIAYNTAEQINITQPLGGGLYFRDPGPSGVHAVRNCILWSNVAEGTPAVFDSLNGESTGKILVRYSDVQLSGDLTFPPPPPWPGNGNIFAVPLFNNGSARDLTLDAASPCIDAGKDDRIFDDWGDINENGVTLGERTMYDFTRGQAREVDSGATGGPGKDSGPTGIVDMGAHERQQ
jgi:predicted outer membrane repeat protein